MLNVAEPKDMSKTNQPKIRLQGTTEARATVTINGNPVLLSATSFMSNLDLIEGDNTFTVQSCDLASNCNSTVVHVFLDTAPPTIDVTSPKDELLTKVGHVTVIGTVEDCAKVSVNGKPVTYIGNEFAYDVTLKEGKNVILVEATDDVNNKASVSLIVNLDSMPPMLTLNEPKDGVTVNKAEINIDGTTETDAQVTVAGKKVTNANGGYITKYTLVEGLNEIKVSATDLAGNIVNVTVKVTLDTKVALQVKGLTQGMAIQTTNQTCNISGTADKDASVYVNDLPVKVKSDGTFKTEVPLDLGTNNISVLAEDPLGNRVTYSYQVVRKSPPSPPPNPIISGEGPLGGLLVPLLIVVAIVAAVGIGGGLYMRKKSKAAQTALPPAAPVVAQPAAAPAPAAPTMMAPPPPTTYYDPQQAAQPAQPICTAPAATSAAGCLLPGRRGDAVRKLGGHGPLHRGPKDPCGGRGQRPGREQGQNSPARGPDLLEQRQLRQGDLVFQEGLGKELRTKILFPFFSISSLLVYFFVSNVQICTLLYGF
jgi:uncharacterized Zn-binding protein involved in type VI secretion